MKHIFLAACAMLVSSASLFAQNAKDATVRYQKTDRPGMAVEYEIPKADMEEALLMRMETSGPGKPKSKGDFFVWQGINWPEVATGQVDVYLKVDGSRKKSNVILLVSKGYDNFVNQGNDAATGAQMKTFLDGLQTPVNRIYLNRNIVLQETVIRRSEQSFNDLRKQSDDLQKELERLNRKIADNKAAQEKQQASWDGDKTKLEQLRGQVK
jgi:peptidoglycan hydrolase CwlO-like protein